MTTFWPKSEKSKSFASDLKTDDIENVAKELISDTSGFTVFGVGEMKMTLEDMATNLMLSKARRVPRQAKEESLFTTVDSKKFKELQNRYDECESLVESIENKTHEMVERLKDQSERIENFEEVVEQVKIEKQVTVVEKDKRLEIEIAQECFFASLKILFKQQSLKPQKSAQLRHDKDLLQIKMDKLLGWAYTV